MKLSPSQVRVVAAKARGLSTAETAASLRMSAHPVKTQLRHAAKLMGATSTTHLVALAIAYRELPAGTALESEVPR